VKKSVPVQVEKHQCLAFPGPAQDVPLIDPAACGGGGGGYGGGGGGGGGSHHGGGGDHHGAGFSTGGGGDVGGYAAPNPGYTGAGSSQAYIVQDVGQGYSLPQQQHQPSGHSAAPASGNYDGGSSSGGHVAFSGGYVAPTGGGQGSPTSGGYLGPTGGFSSPSSGLGQSGGGGYSGGNGGLVDTYGYDAYDDVGRLVTRDTQVSSSENLQTIESVPGSLLEGAGKMVGTLHEAGASLFNRAMSFLPSTRIRRRLTALAEQQSRAKKKKSTVGVRRHEQEWGVGVQQKEEREEEEGLRSRRVNWEARQDWLPVARPQN